MLTIPDEIFEIGILNREYHERLLMDLPRYARVAGIPPHFVWAKMSQYCTDDDVQWIKAMRGGTSLGLIYVGAKFPVPVEDKMMAIVGLCMRNYIDARFMPVQTVLSNLKDGDMPSPTLVLVPNFCMSKGDVSGVMSWQGEALLGWLYSRMSQNKKTVLYVGDMDHLSATYGESMAKHLRSHYTLITPK